MMQTAQFAEIADGAAKGCSSMAFLVIGTGVGEVSLLTIKSGMVHISMAVNLVL